MTDVVYVVGPGGDHEDLRYSLRSLRNLDGIERVWIVGHKPGWAVNVEHIPTVQTRSRFRNSTANVLAACQHPGLDRFALFNDDFFAVAPTDIPTWHRGPVGTAAPDDIDRIRTKGSYTDGLAATCWLLDRWGFHDPYNYDLHVPMWVNAGWMAEILDRAAAVDIEALHKRTLYGNVVGIGGQQSDDPKVGDTVTTWGDGQTWVSTSDKSFAKGAVGRRIRSLFPDESIYEERS